MTLASAGVSSGRRASRTGSQGGEEQEIVARYAEAVRRQVFRGDDQEKHGAAEQAGPALFQAEHQEFDQRAGKAVRRQPVEHAMRGSVDPLLNAT